jgi:hypothetical protein
MIFAIKNKSNNFFGEFMKKLLIGLLSLSSLSAFAANTTSLDYSCELAGEIRTGTASIDDQLVVGEASCMYFGKGPTFCFRFERHVKINNIYLALRTSENLRSGLDSNFITLGNIPYSEGATSIDAVKVGLLNKEELSCTYTNVNWKLSISIKD